LFGGFSVVAFLAALAEDGRLGLGRWRPVAARLRRGWTGRLFAIGAAGAACFLGSYTGTLLSATNQPAWADTTWVAPLFLASATSTGVATLLLLAPWRGRGVSHDALGRLERLATWAVVQDLAILAAVALSPRPPP